MADVAIMGGPKHGMVVKMGRGWGEGRFRPDIFWVMEYVPVDPDGPRGRRHFQRVAYHFYGKVGDLLVYKRPGYRVGSL